MASNSQMLRSRYIQWLLVQAFPHLRGWPVREWPTLFSRLKKCEFDQIERIGIVGAVVLASWVLTPLAVAESSGLADILLQLILALPLLVIFAGPFFVRRIRRYLHEAARERLHQTAAPSQDDDQYG